MPLILPGNVASATGGAYEVANSCRFNSADSAYLNRTLGTPTNNKIWTLSFWVKRSGSGNQMITSTDSSRGYMYFGTDQLAFEQYSGGFEYRLKTNRLFRDFSAWYHVCLAVDTTQGTASNRMKLYVNGTQETSFEFATYPAEDFNTSFNSAVSHFIGREGTTYFDGYLAEMVLVDGQALTPTSFGEFDSDSPTIWKPKDVSGLTFGTNGFYLDFEASGNLGNDANGGTDWTENNLAATDQMTDTPTLNYSTIGTLFTALNAPTYSEGNLQSYSTASGAYPIPSSIGVANGKWYMELKYAATTSNDNTGVGITHDPASANQSNTDQGGYSVNYYASNGYIDLYGSNGGTFSSYTVGDIIGIYMDIDNQKLYFSKNGTLQNSGTGLNITTSTTGFYYFQVNDFTSSSNYWTWQWNFGAGCPFTISSGNTDDNGYGNFEYSPNITGDSVAKKFYALNTKNLSEFG